ncbi:phenylacrylic acid decarboxylase [Grosmannia clavigera kw1407]|uniref:Flavin prenyltransferase PAD1, mitochondrial n=1 Tax=Grosmannia clavigera (strain kw1407 / UAMH 11150) TaxID=655863 RepID=F0XL97_GROCL|nr:phenylacrylic acid decarboxylase [Grosmannia clavigera kw1407]EFX01028.1 phenylacrylic acid decarboxylase [Grosmannia clavigera kw1407]
MSGGHIFPTALSFADDGDSQVGGDVDQVMSTEKAEVSDIHQTLVFSEQHSAASNSTSIFFQPDSMSGTNGTAGVHGTNANGTNGTSGSHINGDRRRKRIIVAITGATGAVLGIRALQQLRRLNVETHLIISKWAAETIKFETDYTAAGVRALADFTYNPHDLAAPIASGSFKVDGMLIVPCSVKTLAAINAGICDELITRAADVCLKERRRVVLSVRETPFNEIHLRNMSEVTRAGAIIAPPMVAFYTKPASIDDLLDQMVGRLLDLFDLDAGNFQRWDGFQKGDH